MISNQVEREEIEALVQTSKGNEVFHEVLGGVKDQDQLFRVLANYIAFNGTFGAGVANLAGELGVRQDLFRDSEEPVTALADRSMEVGADIIFAAIDEFDDRSTPHRDTHRTLASATLKAAAQFMSFSPEKLNQYATPSPTTEDALPKVRDGYGVNKSLGEKELFKALGFHMSSEILADEEFNLMDSLLKSKFADLVSHLQSTTVPINGEEHNAYWWVHIHTSVEADHFAFAVRGANSALKYYAGKESPETLKSWILDGFKEFADVQYRFMEGLRAL